MDIDTILEVAKYAVGCISILLLMGFIWTAKKKLEESDSWQKKRGYPLFFSFAFFWVFPIRFLYCIFAQKTQYKILYIVLIYVYNAEYSVFCIFSWRFLKKKFNISVT